MTTQRFLGEAGFNHDMQDLTGVLLCNLGTPDAPTPSAVRRYLREFLGDPRVVEIPRPIWWLILNAFILPFRPKQAAHAYATIWTEQGSPLLVIGRQQREALEQALRAQTGQDIPVALGMCYGKPSIPVALNELREKGVRRVLVLPLYPQYSATTTAAVFDVVTRELQGWRWLPELRTINNYHAEPGYIEALADSVRQFWDENGGRSHRLLMSFHGLPRLMLERGDPYYCQCQATARLLAEKLELGDADWTISFQSRLGRAEWLKPYTDQTLETWADEGVESVDVICPGFAADCLETLEEMAIQNRASFLENGGKQYRYIPCLNDSPAHIEMLAGLVTRHTQGWSLTGAEAAERGERKRRARALGAEKQG